MNFSQVLDIDSTFMLFIAPPAWGKTRMLRDLINKLDRKVVYVSPLKALALEFSASIRKIADTYGIGCSEDASLDRFMKEKRGVLVITPELLSVKLMSAIENDKESYLVVMDELHLFYHWGSSFRPVMWEALIGIMSEGINLLALSATVSDDILDFLKHGVTLNYQHGFVVDLGNRQLLFPPKEIFFYGHLGAKFLNRRFFFKLKKTTNTLIYFVHYRRDVEHWLDFCSRRKIDAIGCVGGEVDKFVSALSSRSRPPSCIFSTTALSHGVNLPPIEGVFIGYKVNDEDQLIQMIGRGGRKGESYNAYLMDSFKMGLWKKIRSTISAALFDIVSKI